MTKTIYYDKFKEDLPTVDGKVFVITGTTSGTGFVAAQCVAEKGGEAVLLNRKSSRVDDMLQKLQEKVPNGKFVAIECDLQNFASVRKAIDEIKSKYKKIYCLSNNAGIMGTKDERTVDGYDTQMQTNHLSHYLLTAGLLPLLEAEAKEGGDARIVNHSSEARHGTKNGLEEKYLDSSAPGTLGGDAVPFFSLFGGPRFERYFHSKLANSVFTHGLHNKLQACSDESKNKIRSVAAHPGGSVTNLGGDESFSWFARFWLGLLMPLIMQTAEDGTMGLLRGMMDPTAESGQLYGPLGGTGTYGPAVINPPKPYETDPDAIEMLWRKSEEATKIKFDI